MGRILYGSHQRVIEIDDRTLEHLRVVIMSKLRRNESFGYSWDIPSSEGAGRATVWLSPAIPLEFRFDGGRRPSVNRQWIQELTTHAASGELVATPETPTTTTGVGRR